MQINDELQTKEYVPGVFSKERVLTISGDDLNVSLDIIVELTQKFINEDLIKIRQTLIQTLEVAACSMMIVADAEKQLDEAINRARIAWSYLKPILGTENALGRLCAENQTFYERKLEAFRKLINEHTITPFNKHMYMLMSKEIQDFPILIIQKGNENND